MRDEDITYIGAFGDMFIDCQYQLIHGDTMENLLQFDSNYFDLVITSPPYNIGKEYEIKKSIESYLEQQNDVIEELARSLSD